MRARGNQDDVRLTSLPSRPFMSRMEKDIPRAAVCCVLCARVDDRHSRECRGRRSRVPGLLLTSLGSLAARKERDWWLAFALLSRLPWSRIGALCFVSAGPLCLRCHGISDGIRGVKIFRKWERVEAEMGVRTLPFFADQQEP